MYKGDEGYWAVHLTDARGMAITNKIVKIGIVGKVYSKRTNDFGFAVLPINLGVGVYDVNATFEDDVYDSAFVNATITVKNPQAILIAEENIVMNHGDGTNYEVTLFDNSLNPIAKAIVHITIRGKTYDRRTDENGTARLPINLAVGTYTISASFDGNSKLSEAERNCTVTVN